MTLDSDWSAGVGWTVLALSLLLGGLSAVAGYRAARWLIAAHGFLALAAPAYSLLYSNLARISLDSHGVLFVAWTIGVCGCVLALKFWYRLLHLYAIALGITVGYVILSIFFALDADEDVITNLSLYAAPIGMSVAFAIFQHFFEKRMIILSTATCGSFVLFAIFDTLVDTGFVKRFFYMVSLATRCDNLFLVSIDFDSFPSTDGGGDYFMFMGFVLLAAVLFFVQAHITARDCNLEHTCQEEIHVIFRPHAKDENTPLLYPSAYPRTVNVARDDQCDDGAFKSYI